MLEDFSIAGGTVGMLLLGLLVLTFAIIFFYKGYVKKQSEEDLRSKYQDGTIGSYLKSRNKYPEVDVLRKTSPIFGYGLAASLALTLFAFSWTKFEKPVIIPDDALDYEEEIEVEPPRTAEPPPPPPPPPPPVIEEVPEEEIEEEDEPEFVDQDVEEETVIEEPEEVVEDAPPPPPPPPPPPAEEEIFKVVEQMPRFPGCEDMSGSNKEKEDCAKQKMLEYIYKNLKYPAIARENGVEGMAVLQFVVEKDGSVAETKIVRDIGAGCGEAALKVVEAMNNMPQKWTPGMQRGRPVKVLYTLPVRFKLEG